jgi:hypothetical protein
MDWLNYLAQAITLISCVWAVISSNLGKDRDYIDWRYSWLSLVPPASFQYSIINQATLTPFHKFSIQ